MKKDIEINLTKEKQKWLEKMPQFVRKFILSIQENKGLSTQVAYLKDYSLFLNYLLPRTGENSISAITVEDISHLQEDDIHEYLAYITNYTKTVTTAKNLEKTVNVYNSKESKARKVASLTALFRYLYRQKLIEENALAYVDIKTTDTHYVKDRLTTQNITQLVDVVMKGKGVSGNRNRILHNAHKYRDLCIIITLAYTGVRISELIQLDMSDLDLKGDRDKPNMLVIRKGDKIEKIYLSAPVIKAMTNYIERERSGDTSPAVFLSNRGTRMVPRTVNLMLEIYGERAEIGIPLTPHTFRRTFATKMLEETGDLQLVADLLGHANVDTTRKHYTVTAEKRRQEAIENFRY